MNLRTIVSSLVLLAILSTLIGGYFYYSALRSAALEHGDGEADNAVQHLVNLIDSQLEEQQNTAQLLAAFDETKMAVSNDDVSVLEKANDILDKYHRALEFEVCYLMDLNGRTIASSNRNDPDSFVGKNYAFRPYFEEAKQGAAATYMALGVTSERRGIYYSYPVYTDDQTTPAGVAVIKASIDNIAHELDKAYDGIIMLTNPQGVVFISNTPDLNYHLLWQLSPGDIRKIARSQQFGKGPWKWIGMERMDRDEVRDRSGSYYHLHQKRLKNYNGWKVVYLHDQKKVLASFVSPVAQMGGYIAMSICLLVVIFVSYLYKQARSDIALKERLRVESLTDELTGLYNRRGFSTLIEHQLKIARRKKMEYYLLYVDLDKLKEINDTFGHQEGDRLLREIAHILKETGRESDIVARLGGDEFVVFYEGNSTNSAEMIKNRLSQKIEINNANRQSNRSISISMGLVEFTHSKMVSINEMLSQAEVLMYEQKRKKREKSGPASGTA